MGTMTVYSKHSINVSCYYHEAHQSSSVGISVPVSGTHLSQTNHRTAGVPKIPTPAPSEPWSHSPPPQHACRKREASVVLPPRGSVRAWATEAWSKRCTLPRSARRLGNFG